MTHCEIPYDDGDRAKACYGQAFAWYIADMPEYEYTAVSTGPTDDDGMPSKVGFIGGWMTRRSAAMSHPVITLDVTDIDAALAADTNAGGSVVVPKQQVGDMGFIAYFADTEGTTIGVWQSA